MSSNYVSNDNTLFLYKSKPTNSYELDFDKIENVKDCVLLIKALMCGFSNGYEPRISIGDTSFLYEELKHLAKDK